MGLGAVVGLSEFEIGPSFRYWINDRFGVQAHLGFSGDDFGNDDVAYLRFEPTVIFAFGDFGDGSVNVRPYAGAGLRIIRTDIGDFNDSDVRPAGVGGVEFGFRALPRLKVSAELSVAAGNDFEVGVLRGPEFGSARVAALAHYFFD
ncbi:MAG: outer membrane beta-barrel protein [Acidobacteria bacterium]|nr:outer membrane beta-barrel protein [Acidobacteriota bacterium]